ncbi:MAG: divergent polysaccharide deacetylase family protein [Clostridiales bacterium]|nr:divergent polysaccharide deacetylase family protein [Clostridiales bacterium]
MIILINKKKFFTYIIFAISCFFIFIGMLSRSEKETVPVMKNNESPRLVIIIDDFGNNSKGTKEMLSLPIKFTGAVMPGMPRTKEECDELNAAGKDIILHMPMEPHKGKKSWLGEISIMNDFTKEKALSTFKKGLSEITNSVGFNNHMGSKVTENADIMTEILKEAKKQNLIVIDSLTGAKSTVEKISKELKINYLKRDVFLDSTQDVSKIIKNLKKAAKTAKENGIAVAIGHVGAEGGLPTYTAILKTYKEFEADGIKFIGVSDVFK